MARLTLLQRVVIVDVGREVDMPSLGEVARYVNGVRPRGEEVPDFARSNSARAVARIVAGSLGPGPLDTSAMWGGDRPPSIRGLFR